MRIERTPRSRERPVVAPLLRLADEGEYFVGEAVRSGEIHSVSVTLDGGDLAVRERVVERFRPLFDQLDALTTLYQ
jgi:hypothetical protein